MAPQNNLERKAARKLAEAQGIKYTEALRRLRATRIPPSEVLALLQTDFTDWPSSPGIPSAVLPDGAAITLTALSMKDGTLDPWAHGNTAATAQELLKIILDTQGEPSISLLGRPGAGKSVLVAEVGRAASTVPDVRVFAASGHFPTSVAGLPEFLRQAQSAQQTALVLLDDASAFVGTTSADPNAELSRAVAEQLILRGHPAAAVLAVSQLPLGEDAYDSGRVYLDWQHMTLPVAVSAEITAAGKYAEARYSALYVPVSGEARLLGGLPAPTFRMRDSHGQEANVAVDAALPATVVDPLAKEECPVDFSWSAFGADYPDTQCENGRLVDMDSRTLSDTPCPFCNPASFTEYQFGDLTIPECTRCTKVLPVGTEIHYHEGDYGSLWWSAACPGCGLQRVNMVDHSDTEGIEEIAQAREDEQRRLNKPDAAPSFILGFTPLSGVPQRAVLSGQAWEHTAVVGERAATTAELVRIAAELAGQGVAVTVFSGSPEQSWPDGVRVVGTGPGRWDAAAAVAEQMEAERAAMMGGPVAAGTQSPVPLVVLVDTAAMDAAAAEAPGDDGGALMSVSLLWERWLRQGRITGWTMVQAMEPEARRGLKEMAWVLFPEAALVSWSGWPEGGRAVWDRRGMIRPVLPVWA